MTCLIAHRGASFEAPENTLSAIKRAIELQVDCIEIDIHFTNDGIPVVIHDSALRRTTNSAFTLTVEQLPLSEIKKLDAGSWFGPNFKGETIPTLQEVLNLDRGQTHLMIEIKEGILTPAEMLACITKVLPENEPTIYIGSFIPEIIEAFQVTSYSLIGIVENPLFIEKFLGIGLKHLALWVKIIEPWQIQRLQAQGVCIWVFTVDDMAIANFLRQQNVDGIITNNPKAHTYNPMN